MDSAGNNRYELLFMDDDVSDPFENVVSKKKQAKNSAGSSGGASSNKTATSKATPPPPPPAGTTKKQNQSEKENKPLNKNDLNKKNNNTNNGQVGGNSNTSNNTGDKFNNKQGGAGVGGGAGAGGANTNNRKRNNGETREGGQGQQQRNVNFRQQNGETREQRNNRRNTRENGAFNANSSNSGPDQQPQQPRQFRDRDNRGPPRSRNFEGGNRKREFDRQSGSDKTGIKAVDKRDGAGAHNWGSVKDTIDDVNKDIDINEKSDDAPPADQTLTEQTPAEEETKELTLDEWKAQQQQRVKPTFNIRKAGEGEDTSQWKKMIVLNNNKKKENESEEELEFDPAMYPQRVGRQQRLLDIQFNFNDGRRGGFGNRGRGRRQTGGNENNANNNTNTNTGNVANVAGGAGGVGGGRRFEGGRPAGKRNYNSDRQQNIAPKVNDESQFPTLG